MKRVRLVSLIRHELCDREEAAKQSQWNSLAYYADWYLLKFVELRM